MPKRRRVTNSTAGRKRRAVAPTEPGEWVVTCPSLHPSPREDVFTDRDNPGLEELAIDYDVSPGATWANMKSYSTVQYMSQSFTSGDFILVNKIDPPPEPPSIDASPEEVLKYQRDNMWVARFQHAKAENERSVYLRVFWCYWPGELPMGSQEYHGQSELILSNSVDIIDPTTISGHAEISHWDEELDGNEDNDLNALYWRQTLDVSKLRTKSKGLSILRRHCKCRNFYNPDKTMFRCTNSECSAWNHQECLVHELGSKLEERLDNGTLHTYLDGRAAAFTQEQKERERWIGDTIAVSLATVANTATSLMQSFRGTPDPGRTIAPAAITSNTSQKKSVKLGPENTNSGRLEVSISNLGRADDQWSGAVVAHIKLIPAKKPKPSETKEWAIKLECLRCEEPLD